MSKKTVGWILTAAGVAVVGWYAARLGWDRLASAFVTMGWGVLLLLTLPLLLFFVHAVGWSYTLSPANRRRIGLLRLTMLQAISYGIAGMLPLQGLVSEPLKLVFLQDGDYDRDDFAASLLVDNTINGISIVAMGLAALVYMAATHASGAWVRLSIAATTVVTVAAFAAAIAFQKKGLLGGALRLLASVRVLAGFARRHLRGADRIDAQVRGFYERNRTGFLVSMFCHFIEKIQGVAEFWVIFHFLGMDVSWGACFFIFGVVSTLENLLFFAQLGGMEAWVSGLLGIMGITRDSINVTAALFRRVRFLFWALAAMALIPITRRLFRRPAVLLAPGPASGHHRPVHGP